MMMASNRVLRNCLGAFADSAVLFPLLLALSQASGLSSRNCLISAGLAYLLSAWIFRIPMPVQPLKSIAAAAIAIGASAFEVRASAVLLGLACLGLCGVNINRVAERIPRIWVHGLQLSLGLLLLAKGWQSAAGPRSWALIGSLTLIFAAELTSLPVLGLAATGGALWMFFHPGEPPAAMQARLLESGFRGSLVLDLVLPQLVLTLANSVFSTAAAAREYFGEEAKRVTPRALLASIGLGNCLVGIAGGLPFCHGSGGLTAHVRGGSEHWLSTWVIGGALLALSYFQPEAAFHFPPLLLSILLIGVGWFHCRLAGPSLRTPAGQLTIFAMGVTTGITQSLLWALGAGMLCTGALKGLRRRQPRPAISADWHP